VGGVETRCCGLKAERRRAFGKPDAGKLPVRFDEGWSETVIGLVPLQPVRSAYSAKSAFEKSVKRLLLVFVLVLGFSKGFEDEDDWCIWNFKTRSKSRATCPKGQRTVLHQGTVEFSPVRF